MTLNVPPEGAMCDVHEGRDALVTCPQCGAHACLACWHPEPGVCHACLLRDPLAAAGSIAWENEAMSWPARYLRTLSSAFGPVRSAPAFATGTVAPARSFFLLSFVPLSLLWGIVQFTHHILFGPSFALRVDPSITGGGVALDVTRASLIGALVVWIQLLAVAAPYLSLVRAYRGEGNPDAAWRVLGYRAFLLPLAHLAMELLSWGAPAQLAEPTIAFLQLAGIVPLVLLFSSMRSAARMAAGVAPLPSLLVALVPMILMFLVLAFVFELGKPFFPQTEELRALVPAEA